MPDAPRYRQLWPLTEEPVVADQGWVDVFWTPTRHPCGHSQFDLQYERVVVEDLGEAVPMSFVINAGQRDVIRRDLREALSPEIDAACRFGEIVHRDTGPVDDHWLLLARQPRITVRSKKPAVWFCPACRQLFYQVRGKSHLLRSELTDAPILVPFGGGLIVSEDLYESRLAGQKWRKTTVAKIPVVDKPQDGLPKDLSTVSEAEVGPPPKY